MKNNAPFIVILLFEIFSLTSAEAQSQHLLQESCKKNVEAKIQGIETVQTSTSSEVKLAGLSIADIRRIQITDGDCAASEEINRRMIEAYKNM